MTESEIAVLPAGRHAIAALRCAAGIGNRCESVLVRVAALAKGTPARVAPGI